MIRITKILWLPAKNRNSLMFFLAIATLLMACDSGPKVIEADPVVMGVNTNDRPVFEDAEFSFKTTTNRSEEHEVIVEETLDTDKYSYLRVKEGKEEFWVAISKRDIVIGDTYIYKGGLLKKNFFSREFDRVFETVYLVSNIRKKAIPKEDIAQENSGKIQGGESLPDLKIEKIQPTEGAISLATLFANQEKYANSLVKVTGKCVKVNPKIMNRNWLHIQDGSGENLDLTITTTENVPLGAIVSLEGMIALEKDFGAGYRYDIIMEGAVLK